MRLPSPGGIPPFQLPKASYQLPTTACSLGLWHCWFLLRINLVIGALSSLILQKCVNSVCVWVRLMFQHVSVNNMKAKADIVSAHGNADASNSFAVWSCFIRIIFNRFDQFHPWYSLGCQRLLNHPANVSRPAPVFLHIFCHLHNKHSNHMPTRFLALGIMTSVLNGIYWSHWSCTFGTRPPNSEAETTAGHFAQRTYPLVN